MSWDEKVAAAVNGAVGGVVGGLLFFGVINTMNSLTDFLLGRSTSWWNGWAAFWVCVMVGFGVGVVCYPQRDREYGFQRAGVYAGAEGGVLLAKRIGVLISAAVAVYFLWQLARGI
jgi:hypothetical protein